jgi:DNA-binding CsgD family transcriptional regulator
VPLLNTWLERSLKLCNSQISALVGSIYASTMHSNQWLSFLEAFCDLFPGMAVSISGSGPDQADQTFASFGVPQLMIEQLVSAVAADQSAARVLRNLPTGQVFDATDLFEDTPFCETEVYQTQFRPCGFDAIAGFTIAQDGSRSLVLEVFYRDKESPGMSGPTKDLLELLAPHVIRATNQYQTLHVTRRIASEFAGLMDFLIIPSIVTDQAGRFLIANSAGDRMLKNAQSLMLDKNKQLALQNTNDTALLREKILLAATYLQPHGFRCYTGDVFQTIRTIPFKSSDQGSQKVNGLLYDSKPRVAVFVGQMDVFTLDDSIFHEVFKLSPSEAAVCRLLVDMQTPTEIAASQNKSLRTVRNQIQAIYAKFGISRHAELADALAVFKVIGKVG